MSKSAFPMKLWNSLNRTYEYSQGMDLRDYFAAKAMQAFLNKSDRAEFAFVGKGLANKVKKENGTIRDGNYCHKYKGEFEVIDTEIKAYFLGFMYGDGCLGKKGKEYNSVRISIDKVDSYILDRFCLAFPIIENTKYFDYSIYVKGHVTQGYICLNSGPASRDLQKHGLVPRKSYENKNLLRFPKIPKKLEHHFVRGFFDADGAICLSKRRPNSRRIWFSSVSETFIMDLKKWFESRGFNDFIYRMKPPKHDKKSNIKGKQWSHVLEFTRNEHILKARDLFYKDVTIYLTRKKDRFDSFRIVDKVLDRNIKCPNCESLKTISGQIRYKNHHRYKCKDCNKWFTIIEKII